ncbi:uncharacterized protein LOC122507366 [Leptopilina heterotoma]|uniref:uncharacterized protein LOC122507366 n=1 Tax=Leptopilina heterotoma TaxID=63436 RepID=UPI001CA9DA87|nr:uncharacterized protein LOC122507366 [Leptopilina heterotoma]
MVTDECLYLRHQEKAAGIRKIQNEEFSECNVFENEVDKYVEDINTISVEQRKVVKRLLMDNREVFSNNPGCTSVYSHVTKPIREHIQVRKSYSPPLTIRQDADKEIIRMKGLNIIKRSNSNICNPLRCVKKKDGSIRLCIDAR